MTPGYEERGPRAYLTATHEEVVLDTRGPERRLPTVRELKDMSPEEIEAIERSCGAEVSDYEKAYLESLRRVRTSEVQR